MNDVNLMPRQIPAYIEVDRKGVDEEPRLALGRQGRGLGSCGFYL